MKAEPSLPLVELAARAKRDHGTMIRTSAPDFVALGVVPDCVASVLTDCDWQNDIMSHWARLPSDPGEDDLSVVSKVLDPVLAPLGFAPAQVATSGDSGQIIFCRGEWDSDDAGCVDLVLDVESAPEWRIVDVRYWGFESDRWHLDFDRSANLPQQLAGLARTIPHQLAD